MTKSEAIRRILLKLRDIESNEEAGSDDVDLLGAKYNEVYAELNRSGLVNWGLAGEIPDTHAQAFIAIIASRSADDYHVDEQRYQRLMIESQGAFNKLKQMEHIPYVSTDEPVYY